MENAGPVGLILPYTLKLRARSVSMEDLLWLGIVAGLALLAFAYVGLCDRA